MLPAAVQRGARFTNRLDSPTDTMYAFNVYKQERIMPRAVVNENSRLALRIRPADKALLMRAVALAQTDLTDFVLRTAMREARAVIDAHEAIPLTRRDSRLVMELLESPPAPNARLRKAARALPKRT